MQFHQQKIGTEKLLKISILKLNEQDTSHHFGEGQITLKGGVDHR
jgi:hypothetical protein